MVSGPHEPPPEHWHTDDEGRPTTTRLPPGTYQVRLLHSSPEHGQLFSDISTVVLNSDRAEKVYLELKPGLRFVGRLGHEVPRPVQEGRAWALVLAPSHDWTVRDDVVLPREAGVSSDGTFFFDGLPMGPVQVLVLCKGWSSQLRSPSEARESDVPRVLGSCGSAPTFDLIADSQEFFVDMDRTATLELTLRAPDGTPARGIDVDLELIPSWDSNQWFRWPDANGHRTSVTGEDGVLRIEDIPPGEHLLSTRGSSIDLPMVDVDRVHRLRFSARQRLRESFALEHRTSD
jgi:hypothetical protein